MGSGEGLDALLKNTDCCIRSFYCFDLSYGFFFSDFFCLCNICILYTICVVVNESVILRK